jgi:hypothetical protein
MYVEIGGHGRRDDIGHCCELSRVVDLHFIWGFSLVTISAVV